ncbi:MAG TPA: gamma-glutamyltransferase [Bacteriovoracaceae bacterium]|nr:gamma-glutamyltransferase [Bacteriovoracaceae bacterium]
MRGLSLLLIFISCSHQVKIVAPTVDRPRVAHEATSKKQMVASQGGATTRAALAMFKDGGNIIDAFVAASFTISVERPHSTGLGGGGFLLFFLKKENKVFAFDFREIAPLAARSGMYLDKNGEPQPMLSQNGALAVATPGLVKGLYEIHKRYGKLAWKDTLAPAIKLARDGFPLYQQLQEAVTDKRVVLSTDPDTKEIFLTPEAGVPLLGHAIVQRNLARTLQTIAEDGSDGFYKGKVAQNIIKTVSDHRGILTQKDLSRYEVKQRDPVHGPYQGLDIYSMPPPSSGGIHVVQILKMLEPHGLKKMGPQSADATHLTALAMQRAFIDRASYLGDPDFNKIPVKELVAEEYLMRLSKSIDTPEAIKADALRPIPLLHESPDTTHFTIADEEGNLVATTQTINGWFGSGVVAKNTGVFLNNEMDDFAQKVGAQNLFGAVGGKNNLVEPRKRPLSSMSPTVILKNNEPYMALGSPSGTRIITCVAQTILNAVEFDMPLYEAVAATRIHQQWYPDELKIEEPFLSSKTESELKKRGHNVVHGRLGCSIQAVKKEKGQWVGVSDPRGEGLALGL